MPGMKNIYINSNPFGTLKCVAKIAAAETIPNKPKVVVMIGLQRLIRCKLYKCKESQIADVN